MNPLHRHYTAAFCLDFGLMAGFTAMPFYIYDHLDGDAQLSGTILAVFSLTYAVVCLASARLVDRVRNGLFIAIAGSFWFALIFSASALTTHTALYIAAIIVGCVGIALAWPALYAWGGAEPNQERRGHILATFNMSWSLGLAAGSLVAGFLYDLYFRLPFVTAALFSVACACILLTQPHERDYFGDATLEAETARGLHSKLSEAQLLFIWTACLVGWSLMGASRSVYPKHLDDMVSEGRLSFFTQGDGLLPSLGAASLFSILAFALTGVSLLVFFIMARTRSWHYSSGFIIVFQLAAGAAFWLMGTTHSFAIMILAFAIIGANNYVAFFAAIYYSVADVDKKHMRVSINEGIVGAGNFLGAILFAWLATITDLTTPFIYTPLALIPIIALELLLLRRGLKK